jgi:hypothetical protein
METRGARGYFIGSIVGAMLTVALIAILYAGWRLADLSFVPFDVFDWMTRILPGALIEFVIGSMVATIRSLHLGTIHRDRPTFSHGSCIWCDFLRYPARAPWTIRLPSRCPIGFGRRHSCGAHQLFSRQDVRYNTCD